MPFEVDVQPLASCLSRLVNSHGYEGLADAWVTCLLGDHRVLQPGVNQAIPKTFTKPIRRFPSRATTHPKLCRWT
jgi:hypothetical protein